MRPLPRASVRARRAAAAGFTALALVSTGSTSAAAHEPLTFALEIAVARGEGGEAVATDGWIAAQVASADALFAPYGVRFDVRRREAPAVSFARTESRDDRDALARYLTPGVIDVFVTGSLRDVDEPTRYRMGVHWRMRKDVTKRYVILSAAASPTVLAHELGHYFGNAHSKVVNNVMSYARDGGPITFNADQGRRIRAAAIALAAEHSAEAASGRD